MLDPERIEDTAKIVNEAIKEKVQVNLIINNRAGGNAPLIAQNIAIGSIPRNSRVYLSVAKNGWGINS